MSEKAAKKKAPAKKAAAKKTAKPKKEEKPKAAEEARPVVEKVKLKPVPQPFVLARHAMSMRERPARGYSLGELGAADITFEAARSMGVPVDVRRRSALDGNTEKLKGWYQPAPRPVREAKPKAEKPAKPKAKKAAK